MYSALGSLKGIIKVRPLKTDNAAFQLHYILTFIILIAFSIIITSNQFFGDPIDCFTAAAGEVPGGVLDNYCWVQSTYTLPDSQNKEVGKEVIYPGIDKATPNQQITYKSYYQWVCFFLFFAAVMFYLPRYLWKIVEGGKLNNVVVGVLDATIYESASDREARISKLAIYVRETLHHHSFYAYGFIACEVLNFANVIGQMYFSNALLGGEFTTYGTEVVQFAQSDQINRTDPMVEVFPRMTKCSFYKFGASGDVQNHDALCILPINIINEKIFIFLWFWYILLAIISGLVIVYRIVLLICKSLRTRVLLRDCNCTKKNGKMTTSGYVRDVMPKCDYGDWFFLHLLSKNINTLHYCDLMEELDRLLSSDLHEDERDSLKSSLTH